MIGRAEESGRQGESNVAKHEKQRDLEKRGGKLKPNEKNSEQE